MKNRHLAIAMTGAFLLLAMPHSAGAAIDPEEKEISYMRTVEAAGGGTGDLYLSLGGVPFYDHPGGIEFEYTSQTTGYCDGSWTWQVTFVVKGTVQGTYTLTEKSGGTRVESGEWFYNGLAFLGPGGPGFSRGFAGNETFVGVASYPWVKGDLAGVGPLSIAFVSSWGSASGFATWERLTCSDAGDQVRHVITNLDPDICNVALTFYWSDDLSGSGLMMFDSQADIPSGTGMVHVAKVYDPCADFDGKPGFNPRVETLVF